MKLFQKKRLQQLLLLLISGLFAISLVACSQNGNDDDDDDDDATEESVVAEACEHMQEGPHSDITATTETAASPSIAANHTNYRVVLSGSGDNYVQFAADEATDYVFMLSQNTTPVIMDTAGTAVSVEETENPTECSEVVVAHTVELEVGTYYLNFNATSATQVSIVVEESGEDHDHDDDE